MNVGPSSHDPYVGFRSGRWDDWELKRSFPLFSSAASASSSSSSLILISLNRASARALWCELYNV